MPKLLAAAGGSGTAAGAAHFASALAGEQVQLEEAGSALRAIYQSGTTMSFASRGLRGRRLAGYLAARAVEDEVGDEE